MLTRSFLLPGVEKNCDSRRHAGKQLTCGFHTIVAQHGPVRTHSNKGALTKAVLKKAVATIMIAQQIRGIRKYALGVGPLVLAPLRCHTVSAGLLRKRVCSA